MRGCLCWLLVATCLLGSKAGQASAYTWSYSDFAHSGSGTLTVTGGIVTAISGTWDGSPIIQLITDGSCCGAPGADNVFNTTPPYLSGNGMAFQVSLPSQTGFFDIAWFSPANTYSVLDGNGNFTSGAFSASLAPGTFEPPPITIPAPPALGVLALGLAALAGVFRAPTERRRASA